MIPSRADYWADHYYDGRDCDGNCGLCETAEYCDSCRVTTCYRGLICWDCPLYDNCREPRKFEIEEEDQD